MADPTDTALNPAASVATGSETENQEKDPTSPPILKPPGDLRDGKIDPNAKR